MEEITSSLARVMHEVGKGGNAGRARFCEALLVILEFRLNPGELIMRFKGASDKFMCIFNRFF